MSGLGIQDSRFGFPDFSIWGIGIQGYQDFGIG
jgi:hypothetical protein